MQSMPTLLYDDRVLYHASGLGGQTKLRAWAFNGWQAESLSWKHGCYIHAGLSGNGPLLITGAQALGFIERLCLNSFSSYPVGSMKHAVMCTADGLIAAHGILERKGEEEFELWASTPWPLQVLAQESWDVQATFKHDYLFQIAGPRSLELLEHVTGEDLRDIKFLRFRDSQIGAKAVEVARIGMSGNLAYELHGPMADAQQIYDTVYAAGAPFGLERLGWGTYLVNHVEGGFPQGTWTFVPHPGVDDAQALAFLKSAYHLSGSVDHGDVRARYRTPVEVGWHTMCKFDHDFIGRAALEKEVAQPRRTVATLCWNKDDVLDISASLLRDGPAYKPIDLPYAPNVWPQAHADHLYQDGRRIGYSSGTIYSYHFREVLSMACIDVDAAELGNEVEVAWGDYGQPIKHVRARVERFPFLTEARNSAVDVTRL